MCLDLKKKTIVHILHLALAQGAILAKMCFFCLIFLNFKEFPGAWELCFLLALSQYFLQLVSILLCNIFRFLGDELGPK